MQRYKTFMELTRELVKSLEKQVYSPIYLKINWGAKVPDPFAPTEIIMPCALIINTHTSLSRRNTGLIVVLLHT